eukprot:CAMPEP_0119126356 /NCGR_PEP_ID=MMETSP1310-20130426/5316_1 /TAXON_ID=464262 /ORGANISM="Genus nov. species nov., Strain RCC2339" /LENGTH=229 /DNA_ID=CAMNT_0007116513 /DNA_START=69 /DNA_END=758 /DNA_ORIENTATION=-
MKFANYLSELVLAHNRTLKNAWEGGVGRRTPAELSRDVVTFSGGFSPKQWKLFSDSSMGGNSTVHWEYDEEKDCAVFHGNLDLTVPEKSKTNRMGFGATVSPNFLPLRRFEYLNAFELEVRGDGRNYIFNVTPNMLGDDLMLYQAVICPKAGQWSTIVIPFSGFLLSFRGRAYEGQRPLDSATAVQKVGFLMAERKDGPYRLEVKSIRAVRDVGRKKRYDPFDDPEELQ